MQLRELGEFGLIEKIRRITPKGRGVRLGIGDDAAWIECRNPSLLLTSDLLIEGLHFHTRWTSFYGLGYKSLAVNLSDLAAMGGTPAYLVLSLGIPIDFKTEDIEEFYRGVRLLASRSGVALVGGDTSAAREFIISAALVGFAPHGAIVRSGAKAGDEIYVTGTVGDAALGLEVLKKNLRAAEGKGRAYLVSRHHFPTARLKAGAILARERLARAMIDVSDGLVQDLGHICKASGVGAVLWQDSLPLSAAYRRVAGDHGTRYALTGGEDYELLFCLRPRDRARLERVKRRLGVQVTRIGKCLPPSAGINVLDGEGEPLPVSMTGYDHFKKRS